MYFLNNFSSYVFLIWIFTCLKFVLYNSKSPAHRSAEITNCDCAWSVAHNGNVVRGQKDLAELRLAKFDSCFLFKEFSFFVDLRAINLISEAEHGLHLHRNIVDNKRAHVYVS